MDGLKNTLEEKGINPSYQRLKILEYLVHNKNHPTADDIYKELSKEVPTLSKTTVYNTLKTFHEKRIVLSLTIEENEVRYDADTSFHAHLKCLHCGNLYDIEVNKLILKDDKINGHRITESHLYFKGTCCNCLKRVYSSDMRPNTRNDKINIILNQ